MDQEIFPDRIFLPREQVKVNFPGHAGKIQVITQDLPEITPPETKGVFKPVRLVINLKLWHAGQREAKVLRFDPPIEVRVRYYTTDPGANDGSLRMAYWDEENKKWIPFTKGAHFFNQEPLDTSTGIGWVSVMLKEWGDPPIAVGT